MNTRASALALALALFLGGITAGGQTSARIVAIGDVHGDPDAFVSVLTETKLVNGERAWTAGPATLVQTGDLLDRGAAPRAVLDLAMSLERGAQAAGGRALFLLGNHEAMNALGELRDVSPAAYAAFADDRSERRREDAWDAHRTLARSRRKALSDAGVPVPAVFADVSREAWMSAHPPGKLEYLDALSAAGPYGTWLRARPVAVQLGDVVFAHGGWSPDAGPRSVDDANERVHGELAKWDEMRRYLIDHKLALPSFVLGEMVDAGRAELSRAAIEARASAPRDSRTAAAEAVAQTLATHPLRDLLTIDSTWLLSPAGPLWFRGFATWTDAQGTAGLATLDDRLGRVTYVVGHTMPRPPRITPRFDGRIFLIDTGISSVYRSIGGVPSALEIEKGVYTAVYLGDRKLLVDKTR